MNFFIEILPQDDSKRGNQFKSQNNTLRPFLSSPRIYIYGSGKMHLDIIKRFELLTKTAENVHIAYAECDHHSQCTYTTVHWYMCCLNWNYNCFCMKYIIRQELVKLLHISNIHIILSSPMSATIEFKSVF